MAQLRCCLAVSIILALGCIMEGDSAALNTDPVASFGLRVDGDETVDKDSYGDVVGNTGEQFLNLGDEDDGEHNGPYYGDNGYPLRGLRGTHGTIYKTRNSPRQGEDCYYPHRSNKPLYCSYYVTFGNYTEGDEQISDETYKKEPSISETPFIVEVDFPNGTGSNEYTIKYVYVEDTKGSKRIKEDDLVILKGGIGDKFMHLKIESDYGDPDGYRVAIYGKS